jgi:molybdopterin biosynthesis enzyme MoaB
VPTAIFLRAPAGVCGKALVFDLSGHPKAIGEWLPPPVPVIRG